MDLHESAVGPDLVLDSVLLVDVGRLEDGELLDPGRQGHPGNKDRETERERK